MKRFTKVLCLVVIIAMFGALSIAKAAGLSQALSSDKPFALLVYTSWSDFDSIYNNMKKLQPKFTNYSFIRVNLNDEEAAALFNGYIIVKNVPMVIIGKQGGRFNQLIDNSCASDYQCMAKKLKRFAR